MSYSYIFKFIIIGDTGVGKSCFLLQFIDNRFRLKHQPTIGVQFGAKTIEVKDKPIKLQVWDTAGQQSFRSITRGYYRSAAGAILIYDIANRDSFQNLINWLNEAKSNASSEMTYILVGNKCDLQLERQVTFEEGVAFAKEHNLQFLQTSAKTAYNVIETFKKSSQDLMDRIEKGKISMENSPPGIKIGSVKSLESENRVQQKKKTCC